MRKITTRGERAGLLELEEPDGSFRPEIDLETVDIPESILEEQAETEKREPFLRAKQRVPVRRRGASRFAWKKPWVRVGAALAVVAGLGLLAGIVWETEVLLLHNSHFTLASAQNIQVTGNRVVPSSQALKPFVPDLGRSVFRVPLVKRQAELENIDWVRTATVMRLWPNRLRVSVVERTPIAFARDGNTVRLVDDDGILLDLPNAVERHYSFPVLLGISSTDPVSTRAARMQMYQQFTHALDADDGHVAATLSEVDLTDPENIRAIFDGGTRNPMVNFGDTDFLARYRAYQSHLTEWLQQYPDLRSVDMRYGRQVVLDMGKGSTPGQQTVAPQSVVPQNSAPRPISPQTNETDTVPHATDTVPLAEVHRHKVATRRKTKARRKRTPAKHSRKAHKRVHERGHTVRDPIAHVVSGM